MRLNLGAGAERIDGYLSVDLRTDVADVVADVRALPFRDGSIEAAAALDLLEHFWRDDTAAVLAEWRRVLAPGAVLTLRVPNAEALCRQVVRGIDVEGSIRNLMGGHQFGPNGAWDTHHWNFTPGMLATALAEAGLAVLSIDKRPNMTVVSERDPESTSPR